MAAGRGCNQWNEGQERAALLCGRPKQGCKRPSAAPGASDLGSRRRQRWDRRQWLQAELNPWQSAASRHPRRACWSSRSRSRCCREAGVSSGCGGHSVTSMSYKRTARVCAAHCCQAESLRQAAAAWCPAQQRGGRLWALGASGAGLPSLVLSALLVSGGMRGQLPKMPEMPKMPKMRRTQASRHGRGKREQGDRQARGRVRAAPACGDGTGRRVSVSDGGTAAACCLRRAGTARGRSDARGVGSAPAGCIHNRYLPRWE